MLYIIGLGLCDEKDITLKGLEAVKASKYVYLENYTSKLSVPVERLEAFYGKKIILADRQLVENSDEIIKSAQEAKVSFLVIGDALSATTHIDLMKRAQSKGIEVELIYNASVMTAVSATGLQLYKFGKVTSIPFSEKSFEPDSFYEILRENQSIKAHTLFLLDIKPDRMMTVNQAIELLERVEAKRKLGLITEKTLAVACARLGCPDSRIIAGKIKDLKKIDFGIGPHCLIIPSKLHFVEEEFLRTFTPVSRRK